MNFYKSMLSSYYPTSNDKKLKIKSLKYISTQTFWACSSLSLYAKAVERFMVAVLMYATEGA